MLNKKIQHITPATLQQQDNNGFTIGRTPDMYSHRPRHALT